MVLITIDDKVYKELQKFQNKNDIDYPSMKFIIDRVVREFLEEKKEGSK